MKSTFLPGPESISKAFLRQLLTPRKRKPPYKHAPATGQRRRIFAECEVGDYILEGEAEPHQPKPEEGRKFDWQRWMSNGVRTVRACTRTE